jgi:hypothetical protein
LATAPAPQHDHRNAAGGSDRQPRRSLAMTRRQLLGSAALATMTAAVATATLAAPDRGEPFSDGTFFDDGTGWID